MALSEDGGMYFVKLVCDRCEYPFEGKAFTCCENCGGLGYKKQIVKKTLNPEWKWWNSFFGSKPKFLYEAKE